MPTNSNQNLLLENIFSNIIKGTDPFKDRTKAQILNDFRGISNISRFPDCPTIFSNQKKNMPCNPPNHRGELTQRLYYIKLVTHNEELKNLLIYFKSAINQLTSDIKLSDVAKLTLLCKNLFTITDTFFELSALERDRLIQAFFDYFASIASLPDAIRIQAKNESSLIILDLMSHATGFLSVLSKRNRNVSLTIEQRNLNQTIYSALISYLGGLGNLTSNFMNDSNVDLNQFEHNKVRIINSAIKTINLTKNDLTKDQLSSVKDTFLKSFNTVSNIQQACQDLFKTTNCPKFNPTNQTKIQNENFTTNLKTVTNSTTITPTTLQDGNTNIASVMKQATPSENSLIQNITFPKTFANQTDSIVDAPALENTHFTFLDEIITALGLGAFTGFLNGGSQILLHIAARKNCSLQAQRLLAVTLAVTNSFAISTLPLIYSIVENLANDETDSLVNSQKLVTCSYAFLTSVVLQSINAGMQFALAKKSILKNLFDMLPLFAGLWMLANSDESIIESIAILGTNILTSLATSSLTYFGLNRFPVNRRDFPAETANENIDVEMEQLNEEQENNSDNAVNEIQKKLTAKEIFFQKNKFISLANLDKIAKYLKDIIDDTQAFSDMQILQPSKELLQTRLTALKNLHAGLISKDFIKLSKDKTPENVEIQFRSNCESLKFLIESINKELQTNHFFSEDRNLKADLNKIEGLDSKNHTFEFKSKLGKIKDNIGFIDTIIKAAFSPNEKNVSNNKPQDNRRNTICFYSSDESRFSIVSSSDESSKSDGYGNTKFNDSTILEVQSLIQTKLNR